MSHGANCPTITLPDLSSPHEERRVPAPSFPLLTTFGGAERRSVKISSTSLALARVVELSEAVVSAAVLPIVQRLCQVARYSGTYRIAGAPFGPVMKRQARNFSLMYVVVNLFFLRAML